MRSKPKFIPGLLVSITVFAYTSTANAYLDPGTGSMILQGLVAGIAVVAVTIKMYWFKFVALLQGKKIEPEEDLLAGLDSGSDDQEE